MSRNKQKLELTWIGKEERPRLEPRILREYKNISYHATHRISEKDLFDNILIKGDNLLALKALEHEFTGKVKCIYIDPPYNTGSAFKHYDDGVEHSLWLSLMRDRLEILRKLLSEDGSIWISIDENEAHYLKVLCDEIFGRSNFIIQNTIKRSAPTGHKSINPTPIQVCDIVISYAKNRFVWNYKPQYTEREFDKAYNKFIENYELGYEYWSFITLNEALKKYKLSLVECIQKYPERVIRFAQPNFEGVGGDTKALILESRKNPSKIFLQKREDYADIYLLKGDRILFYKDKLKEIDGRLVTAELLTNLWLDIPYQGIANEGGVVFQKGKKPEKLIQRILQIATNEGDLVLDSFGGSGTTAAVAHKMYRRWIMVELGEHCYSHIVPRLKSVIDGKDTTGISKLVNWKGGGGFRFYELAPSLLKKDKWGNYIINPEYNAEMLAEAMCKHLGFTYSPSDTVFWEHGHSTESDFIYVTTQQLSRETLQKISDEVGRERTLLICCKAYRADESEFPNLTLRKIPNIILGRCEWDKDDYSSQIENLQEMEEKGIQPVLFES